eukprot:2400341-Amphidinium_carterae.1
MALIGSFVCHWCPFWVFFSLVAFRDVIHDVHRCRDIHVGGQEVTWQAMQLEERHLRDIN